MDTSPKPKRTVAEAARENGKKGGRPRAEDPHVKLRNAAHKLFKSKVARQAQRLYAAQMTLAEGSRVLVKQVSGGHRLVSNHQEILNFLDGKPQDGVYLLTTERPNNMAIDSLLDRAFGKPTQTIELPNNGVPLFALPLGLMPAVSPERSE